MAAFPIVLQRHSWPLKQPFIIAHGRVDTIETISVSLQIGGMTGMGEARPYARYNETVASVLGQLGALAKQLRDDITPDEIRYLLPHGAARNALDLALLDLRAQQAGQTLWDYLGQPAPVPIRTTDTTISIDTPDAMETATRDALAAGATRLKIKLGGPEKDASLEAARLQAVRAAAPAAELIIDANEGWTADILRAMVPALADAKPLLLEQPLPAGDDDILAELKLPCPVYADESVHDRASLLGLNGKYQGINIKLDKAGGLTEALALKDAAREMGLGIMVGCMVAPSRALIPALILAQDVDFADLDGASLLSRDSTPSLTYKNGMVSL